MTKTRNKVLERPPLSEEFYVENLHSKKCCTKQKILKFFRKFITFMISRIGLMIVMIGYVLAGGFLFEALESDYENRALDLSQSELEKMLFKIYKQIESNSTRVKDQSFYTFLRYEIRNFSEFFINATLNGTLTGNVEAQWDFFGSVFYCVTLVSTIGYGHITCKTKLGKIFTIVYSSIGVPLMMLFLANTGSSTAHVFKFVYTRFDAIKRRFNRRNMNNNNYLRSEFENQLIDEDDYNPMNDEEASSLNEYKSANSHHEEYSFINKNKSPTSSEKKKKKEKNSFKSSSKSGDSPKDSGSFKEEKPFKKTNSKSSTSSRNGKNIKSTTTVSIGIRDVELPNEFIQSIVSKDDEKNKEYDSSLVSSTNNSATGSTTNIIKQTDNKKMMEAIKRMDFLIDQNSIIEDDDLDNINNSDNLADKNMLKRIESSENQRNLAENSNCAENSQDEDERSHDFSSMNDYLINSIFEKQIEKQIANKNKKLKKSTSSSLKKINEVPLKRLTSLKSDKKVVKNAQASSQSSSLYEIDENSNTETKLKNKNSTHSKSLKFFKNRNKSTFDQEKDIIDEKPAETASITNKDNNKNTRLGLATGNDSIKSLTIGNEHLAKNKRSFNRSVYSYDYPASNNNKNINRNRDANFKSRSLHNYNQYNGKHLHLIYKQFQQERVEKPGVPMLISLIIMPSYLVCGMLIFSKFENWRKLDALYFCFVTLTSIGFGDIIPGSTLLNKNGNKNNLYISALYIFLGLILIAMCINLMKDQLKNKVKKLARKIGLSNC